MCVHVRHARRRRAEEPKRPRQARFRPPDIDPFKNGRGAASACGARHKQKAPGVVLLLQQKRSLIPREEE